MVSTSTLGSKQSSAAHHHLNSLIQIGDLQWRPNAAAQRSVSVCIAFSLSRHLLSPVRDSLFIGQGKCPSGKRDGDAITNTSGRPLALTLEKQCTESAILDSIDPMISLLSRVRAAMVTESELRKRSVEADLPQDLKAYIVARLVSSIDMYFPHALLREGASVRPMPS